MAGVLGYFASFGEQKQAGVQPWTGPIKVRITITSCGSIKGCRRDVYRLASIHHGFYTTTVKTDSIKHDDQEPRNLVVNIAFAKHAEAVDFVNGLQAWNDLHANMVGAPKLTAHGALDLNNTIYASEYCAEGSDSPEAPASARSVETGTTVELSADWDTKTHQNISPFKLVGGCGLQMCHINDKRFCNKHEAHDKNNFFGMSPSLHKQFDGHGVGSVPTIAITVEKIYDEQELVATEDSGTELRTKVDVRVTFMSKEAFDGCDGVLKDGSTMVDGQPTAWITTVWVLDSARFKYYVEEKASRTTAKWP
ncbi:unnamed protein product [Ectocarpus sp. 8 AP-2014]